MYAKSAFRSENVEFALTFGCKDLESPARFVAPPRRRGLRFGRKQRSIIFSRNANIAIIVRDAPNTPLLGDQLQRLEDRATIERINYPLERKKIARIFNLVRVSPRSSTSILAINRRNVVSALPLAIKIDDGILGKMSPGVQDLFK